MSDDSQDTTAAAPAAKTARKKPAARKGAKPKAKAAEATTESLPLDTTADAPAPREESSAAAEASTPAPAAEAPEARPEPVDDAPVEGSSDPEPIPFFSESPQGDPPGNNKKRRRRKKKSGQSQQGQHPHAVAPSADGHKEPGDTSAPAPVMHAAPRPKLDPEEVAKKAWKMFQAEVGEEGLALIDDNDAREVTRRCFRLAEIFLEEAARRSR
ncbi:hypothetical protein [Luteolibacter marinus]|uniref:hypothetical protein n=1 Tax=Luteolibacter marinus TaxID=2776705 RepID=UPI001869626F|nr:hypothetical protein [Luteolibacter marinus]